MTLNIHLQIVGILLVLLGVKGSKPSKIELKTLGNGSAMTKPIADPTTATLKPSLKIMREMSEAFAPRARRMPISWVRWPAE